MAVIVFAELGRIVKASSVRTALGFEIISVVVSTCIVRCGKLMSPCVVSMTTLLFLIR